MRAPAGRRSNGDDPHVDTAVMCTPRDGEMPYYRILGLLDHALTRQRADVCEDDEEEA